MGIVVASIIEQEACVVQRMRMIKALVSSEWVRGDGILDSMDPKLGEKLQSESERQDRAAKKAARALEGARLTVAVAESCTGGLLGGALTAAGGASAYFMGGVISYSNEAKRDVLGVAEEVLRAHGAVSPQVAAAMAEGARKALNTDIGVSITGIAGPDGGTAEKPVGTTYIALSSRNTDIRRAFRFGGDRAANRAQAVEEALTLLVYYLDEVRKTEIG